jgi:hypothetical protein
MLAHCTWVQMVTNGGLLSLHSMLSVENMMHAGLTAIQLCVCKQTACCSLDTIGCRGTALTTSMLTATSVSVTSFQAPCCSLRWRRMQRLRRCHSCCLPCEAMKLSHLFDQKTCLPQHRNMKGTASRQHCAHIKLLCILFSVLDSRLVFMLSQHACCPPEVGDDYRLSPVTPTGVAE